MTLRAQPTVLVIDDELDLRSMIAESLGRRVCRAAADGAEALPLGSFTRPTAPAHADGGPRYGPHGIPTSSR
jgi:hypothetical protein